MSGEGQQQGLCSFFLLNGSCKFGDSCRLLHERGSSSPTRRRETGKDRARQGREGREGRRHGRPRESNEQRGLCRFFKETGSCRHGDTCQFSHQLSTSSATSVRVQTQRKRSTSKVMNKEQKQKESDQPLRRESKPKKSKDTDVKTDLKSSQVRSSRNAQAPKEPQDAADSKKVKECKFFAKTGKCKFGDKCTFVHSPHQPNPTEKSSHRELSSEEKKQESQVEEKETKQLKKRSKRVCKYWRSAEGCRSGDTCKFSHSFPARDSNTQQGQQGQSIEEEEEKGKSPGQHRSRKVEGEKTASGTLLPVAVGFLGVNPLNPFKPSVSTTLSSPTTLASPQSPLPTLLDLD